MVMTYSCYNVVIVYRGITDVSIYSKAFKNYYSQTKKNNFVNEKKLNYFLNKLFSQK